MAYKGHELTREQVVKDYTPEEIQSFWESLQVQENGCWLFVPKASGGYRYQYGGVCHHGIPHSAHRMAYALTKGTIPAGYEVCHVCDTPLCCRPEHLFVGTHQENVIDFYTKRRARMLAALAPTAVDE